MKIKLHGGDCCGIKHIHELGYWPDMKLSARKPIKRTSYGQSFHSGVNDMLSKNPNRRHDFFNQEAPKETYSERLDRFIKFIKSSRKHGVIEVVITSISQAAWKPVLEEKGFKLVSSGINSNTTNYIDVYHLVH